MQLSKYILSIVFLLQSLFIVAQNENADAEFLSLKKVYTLHEDGSWDYRYSHKLKLNTHYSFHRLYGETFIVYNPQYQSLEINKSVTTMADGSKVASPENAFNEVLPAVAKDAPAYNHLKEMVVTHTALEVGAVIEMDYTLHNKKGFSPSLMGMEVFGTHSPIHQMIVQVIVPKNVELKFTFKNMRLGPEITFQENTKIYTWKAESLPLIPREQLSGEDYKQQGLLIFAQDDLFKVFNRYVNQEAFRFQSSNLFEQEIERIKKENNDELEQVLAIQDLVVNTINYYYVPQKYAAYQIRTPEQVWKSNGGTRIEKTILLAGLLNQAGFRTTAVAFFPDFNFNKQYGVLDLITDELVRVRTKSHGDVYLSALHSAKRSEEYELGKGTLLFLDATVESLQTKELSLPLEHNICSMNLEVADNGTLEGDVTVKMKGNHIPYFELNKDENKISQLFAGLNASDISEIKMSKLDSFKSDFSCKFYKVDSWKEIEGYTFVKLPTLTSTLDPLHLDRIERERKLGIDLGRHLIEEMEYTIVLPKNYKFVGELIQIEDKNILGSVSVKIERNDDKIIIKRSIDIREYFIKPSEIKHLMKLLDVWNSKGLREVILKEI
ncbi:MAG: DUF3857 domain-containing protein [Bacteroidales bacterium]|nr:DUF3857 domain-containing protein [Bacteroidales bacterium]